MQHLIVRHFSPEYWQTVELRYQILRVPLGIDFTYGELRDENDSAHLAIQNIDNQIVACLIMKPINQAEIKMRQVAVAENLQGQGVGSQLVRFSEEYAKKQGFELISLHARETAVPFYLKAGYEVIGERFEEVNIPHFKMIKYLG